MSADLITYLTVRDKHDKATRRPGQRHTGPWSELVAMLTRHAILPSKDLGLGFAPLTLMDAPCTCGSETCPGQAGHLISTNVLAFNALMLDCDKYRGGWRQLDQTGAEYTMGRLRALKLRHCVYSTFSHRYPDHASLRAGIAISRPVTIEEWPLFFPAVTAWLDIEHDAACSSTVGRFWYLPAHPPGADAIAYAVDGDPVDVDAIMATARVVQAASPRAEPPRPRQPYTPRGNEFDIRELMAAEYPDARAAIGVGNIEAKLHIGGERCPWTHEHTSANLETDTTVILFTSGAWEFECLHSHCRHRDHNDFRKHHQRDWEPYDQSSPRRSDRTPSPEQERCCGRESETCTDDPPFDDPPPSEDVPPPASESDAVESEEHPSAPWKGGNGPLRMANDFISKYARHPDGPTLRKWKGDFYRWSADLGCYTQVTDDQVDAELYRKLRLSRPADVRDTRAALVGVDDVLIDSVEVGSWIGKPTVAYPALDLAACRNGLLHLPSRKLHPATPRYFTTAPLGASYDPSVPLPELWLAFLRQLWPDDQQSIAALQEWFGYMLTPDTRQQKIMMLVGKRRSGKGTIGRVMTALLGGKDSVAAPTLASLGTNFGLWPLIGRTAAIIGDARLSGRNDIAQVVERLLSISGEDGQTVDRKHRPSWTGQLSTRITIISNELPKFTDASDALSGRMLILELTRSFYGEEDTELTDKLLAELPGILLWAIEGWNRLHDRRRFVQPPSSAGLVDDLEDLASPVRAWVRERCVKASAVKHPVEQAKCWALCAGAYSDFTTWCKEEGHQHAPTKTRFGIDLGTIGDIKKVRATAEQSDQLRKDSGQNLGQKRPWIYKGIRLRDPREEDVS